MRFTSSKRLRFVAAAFSGLLGLSAAAYSSAQTPSAEDQASIWRLASGENGERRAKAEPLYRAIIQSDAAEVRRLIGAGASPNLLLAEGGWSPLMVSAIVGEVSISDQLLVHGAEINYNSKDKLYPTALDVALTWGVPKKNLAVFHQLLDRGAEINLGYAPDQSVDIAIHAAVLGQMELVNVLLARGYRRDLHGLRETLQIIRVNEATEPAKKKALRTIKGLLRNR